MSNIGSSLSDCCSYLESPKKTERRKRIEELKLLLDNAHTIQYLNKNSESQKELSWNKVFCSLHKCVLKESDCISEEKTKKNILPSTDKAVKGCCGLLVSVVIAANTGYPHLQCQELFSCILEVCEAAESNEIIRNSVILETYVNLLGLSLSSENYWGELTFKTWKDLGKFSLGILRRLPSEKMKPTIISILNIVLLQGGRLSPLIVTSRPLLVAFPELLQAMVKSKYPLIELSCLHITHTFCTQFAKEFRIAVCHFIDKILPYILSLNENRISDARFKDLIAEVLMEMMSIRMTEKEWHQEALSVLAFSENELSNISKHKIIMPSEIPKIALLAVKLVKQIHTLGNENDDWDASATKRRKISTTICSVLDNLRLHWNNPWPWLCYLDQLLEKAPEVVLDEDIQPLCQYFSDTLSKNSDPVSLRFLTKSSVRLLNLSKEKFGALDKCSQELLNILWTSVLRSVTTSALCDIELNLVNDLIPEFILPECAKSLLEFFIEKKISVTKKSLTTVFYLSSAGLIGSPTERSSLISWCLSGELYSPETVFCLLLRTKCLSPPSRFHCNLNLTDAESFYVVTSFGIVPSTAEEPSSECFNLESSNTALIEDKSACNTYLTQVIQKLSSVNSPEGLLEISVFLCTLHNYLVKHNISIKKKHDEILEKILPEVLLQLENKLKSSNRDQSELLFMVTNLFIQLSKLNKKIDGSHSLFNLLIELLKLQHKSMEEHREVPSVKKILEVELLETARDKPEITIINAMFAIINTFSENDKIPAYVNLINLCLTELTLTIQSGLAIASAIIKKIVTTKNATQVLMKDILSLEFKLSQKWSRNYAGTVQVLDIVDASIETLFKCDQKGELKPQLYRIISLYCKAIGEKKCGSGIINKFVSLLINVIQVDPDAKYMIYERQTIVLYWIEFLNSRYHEVRIKTAEYLPVLFGTKISHHKKSDHTEAFNRAIKAADNMFLIKEGKTPDDIKEEGLNRSCGALKILLGLTSSCYIWRRQSLFHLFRIISFKNISQSLFGKVHQYLEQSLGIENVISFFEQNLDHVLWNWYKDYKTFEKFPYQFMNYDSLSMFLKEYKTIVVPIYLENTDLEGFSSLCNSLSISKSEIAVSCFPEIIACLLTKVGTEMKAAEEMNSFILQLIDQKTIKSLLISELKKVLLAIFMKLNDLNHFTELCGPTGLQLPISFLLNILINAVNASLGQMQRTIPNPQQSLLVYLSNDYPGHIQFLLQNLLAHISIATTTEIRSLCFLQYITVCDLIASELNAVKKMAGYIILHAIHALLYLMRTDIALQATTYLYRFLEKCFPARAKYVNCALDDIFPAIASLSLEDSDIGVAASKIKELLLSKKDVLPRVVAYLPLEETTASLEEELKSFIERQSPDIVALDRLSTQLSLRKHELSCLYDEVKNSRCFSDDCSKSLVHNSISKLVTLTTSLDPEIRASAARCLGQIGPKTLYTLALKPESSSVPPPMAEKILLLLLPLLVHSDPELCEAASAAACELLCTSEGFASLEQLKGIEKALFVPFCSLSSEKKDIIPTHFSPEKLAWASCLSVAGSTSHKGWAIWPDGDHSAWIRSVVSQLLLAFKQGLLPLLSPIASIQVDVSEELLPYVVDVIIDSSEKFPGGLKIVQSNLAYFFKKHFELRNTLGAFEGSSIYLNRKSVQCMISIVNFYRLKTVKMLEKERLGNLEKLNVSFLHVAYAAQFCKAYITSLLYVELWVESLRSDLNLFSFGSNQSMVPLDVVCQKYPDDGQVLLNILWEDYKELGERDSIEGCARLQLGDTNRRLHYFREMGLWNNLIAEADIGNQKEALTQGLLMSGLLTCASQLNNCNWDAAWRLAHWDIEQPVTGSEDFSSLHYSAIRSALHLKDKQNALSFVQSARNLVLNDLADASLEVAATIYQPLAKLQLITELESWCNGEDISLEAPDTEWTHTEPILWQRGLLVADPQIWLLTAKIARSNSSHLVAMKSIQLMKDIDCSLDLKDEAKAEEAQIHWDSGNFEAAKFLLKNLLDTIENPFLKAKCLLTYGSWMAESKSEGPKVISRYFEEAASSLECKKEDRLAAAKCLAKFADNEYKRISRYFKSPEFEMKKSNMDECRKRLEVFKTYPPQTMEEKKSARIYEFNVEIDEAEMNASKAEHTSFLCLAVREYLYCLQFDESTDDRMYRFISLWLSNNKVLELQKEVGKLLDKVPSYRFISVFPQLVVRITPEADHFAHLLYKLLFRCCEDHPYHCLWHVLALANADVDQPKSESPQQIVPRVMGAKRLVQDLSKSKSVDKIVVGMQKLAKAYISLANLQLNKNKNQRPIVEDVKIPQTERLKQIKDIPYITCATAKTPINKNADYSNVIGIVKFDEIFSVLCGINAPKRIKCLCTDGKKRVELVKGQDDLRQDAIMQQVFSVLNILLEGDKNTACRKLNVRTYKVVPLTQRSGVIEWCCNTEPLGAYLPKAHAKHRPQDFTQNKCRDLLNEVAAKTHEEKLKMFLTICSKFKPVMRHFFFEKFPTSGVWYEKRLAFIKSVATNSMIGYVMGIGDRHVMNILIDQETAELIHIDFGVVFEFGKLLPTPETVPFRLTRDIEDGMGIAGVEGLFRRCCEETLKVLRKHSEPIVTVLEALHYDPLFTWSVKPKSDRSQQPVSNMSAEETNKLAERYVQRLKLKLEGRDEGCDALSVERQVQNLIQEAKDPMNLCRLYRGWQAYL